MDEVADDAIAQDERRPVEATVAAAERRNVAQRLERLLERFPDLDDDTDDDTDADVAARWPAAPTVTDGDAPDRRDSSTDPSDSRPGTVERWWGSGAWDTLELERLADSLPFTCPVGYRRDTAGRWRYDRDGRPVPGARDRTLARSYRVRRRPGVVLVARSWVSGNRELDWVRDVEFAWPDAGWAAVPDEVWDALADRPLGIDAPELAADRLLGVADVARAAGVAPATVHVYVSRGDLVPPVARVGGSPVWTEPIVAAWLASRPGQGTRTDLATRTRRRRR